MKANIEGSQAKQYLERYALEFEANIDSTDEGHIIYLFFIGNNQKAAGNKTKDINSGSEHLYQNNTISNECIQQKEKKKLNKNYDKDVSSKTTANQNKDCNSNEEHTCGTELKGDFANFEKDIKKIGNELQKIEKIFKF